MVRPYNAPPPGEPNENLTPSTTSLPKFTGKMSAPTYEHQLDEKSLNTRNLTTNTRLHCDTLPPITGAKTADDAFREFDRFCEERIMIQFGSGELVPQRYGIDTDPKEAIPDRRIWQNLLVGRITTLNALQRKTIPLMREGYALLVEAPTGIGKTYAFLIPAIERALEERRICKPQSSKPSPYVLIMSTTNRLVNQLHSRCQLILGHISRDDVEPIKEIKADRLVGDWRFTDGQCDIAFATMGKLEATIKEGGVCLDNLKLMILDEADKMVDETAFGMSVNWVYDQLKEEVKKKLQTCFYSATYLHAGATITLTDIQSKLIGEQKTAVLVCPRKPGYITQTVFKVPRESGKLYHPWMVKMAYINKLIDKDLEEMGCSKESKHFKHTMAIFCETVGRVNQVAMALRLAGYNFRPVSRMITKVQQEVTLNDLAHGKILGVVCTNIMARGIDISTIGHTIVMEMSTDFDTYKHRIGRVGRDGSGGKATVLIEDQHLSGGREGQNIEALVEFMTEMEQAVPDWLEQWYSERMEAYASINCF